MSYPLVLYHASCWDGFCAAWVARTALGSIEAIPVQYGQPVPVSAQDREVYVLDFVYPLGTMEVLAKEADHLVVLDHHKTAQETLMTLMTRDRNVIGTYNEDKSGARLAWEYFADIGGWQGMPAPWLVDYTEDRDLWRHALPNSQEVNAALRSYPLDFDLWDREFAGAGPPPLSLVTEGRAIRRRERQIIEDHLRHARVEAFDGYWSVPMVNATVLFSEIAGELAKDAPFGACYFDRQDGKRQWSLRSTPDGADVGIIAQQYGGGGHRHAAGFEQDLTIRNPRLGC